MIWLLILGGLVLLELSKHSSAGASGGSIQPAGSGGVPGPAPSPQTLPSSLGFTAPASPQSPQASSTQLSGGYHPYPGQPAPFVAPPVGTVFPNGQSVEALGPGVTPMFDQWGSFLGYNGPFVIQGSQPNTTDPNWKPFQYPIGSNVTVFPGEDVTFSTLIPDGAFWQAQLKNCQNGAITYFLVPAGTPDPVPLRTAEGTC